MTIGSDAVIVSIHVSEARGRPLLALTSAELVQGQGIVSDKRCSPQTRAKNQLTLIEEEALLAAAAAADLKLEPGCSRRNLVTRHVALNHLVGRRFAVGEAIVLGIELCEPCGHLGKCTADPFSKALVHRGGLRCEIVQSGRCRVGDAIRP